MCPQRWHRRLPRSGALRWPKQGGLAQAAVVQEQNALLAAQSSLTQERKLWEIAIAEAQEQAQSADQARQVAETRLTDSQRLVEQQASQLAELVRQRDGLQQRANQLTEAFDTHKCLVTTEREAQAAHIRAVEDRAHTEIDRAREETKAFQATVRQKDKEVAAISLRLETSLASVRKAERLATEHEARAKTLDQQLARMDGLPAALLATQRALQSATKREAALQNKLAAHRSTRASSAKAKSVAKTKKTARPSAKSGQG